MSIERNGTCSLCGGPYTGFGHNPEPLARFEQRCCDTCNTTKVVLARLDQYREAEEAADGEQLTVSGGHPPDCARCEDEAIERGEWGIFMRRMILCPTCGNKRCPKATDHRLDCTGSNEPGQPGSRYVRPISGDEVARLRDEVAEYDLPLVTRMHLRQRADGSGESCPTCGKVGADTVTLDHDSGRLEADCGDEWHDRQVDVSAVSGTAAPVDGDLVARLREHADRVAGGGPGDVTYDSETLALEHEAADEIERLRARVEQLEAAIRAHRNAVEAALGGDEDDRRLWEVLGDE